MSKFITGVAIGVLVGILIAPDKGSATRKKISEKGKDLKGQFNDFVDYWAEKIDSLRGEVEEEVTSPSYPAQQPYSV
jgi:gas vesicle protein